MSAAAENESLGSYTIKQFCQRHQMAKSTYAGMQKQGVGPREIRYGRLVRISADAEAAWMRAMENPSGKFAAIVDASRKRLVQRGRTAAMAAVKSQHHVSKQRRKARV